MKEKTIKKQTESKQGDAIIAIDESGIGHMIIMLTDDSTILDLHEEVDVLPELDFSDCAPGMYYAKMKITLIPMEIPRRNADDDDIEVHWDIVEPIYTFTIKPQEEED